TMPPPDTRLKTALTKPSARSCFATATSSARNGPNRSGCTSVPDAMKSTVTPNRLAAMPLPRDLAVGGDDLNPFEGGVEDSGRGGSDEGREGDVFATRVSR